MPNAAVLSRRVDIPWGRVPQRCWGAWPFSANESWKEGEVTGPAGDVELDDSDLENASGGALVFKDTAQNDTYDCTCGSTDNGGTCMAGTAGCCEEGETL